VIALLAAGAGHAAPDSIFSGLYRKLLASKPGWFTMMGLDDPTHGMTYFEAMCFSVLAAVLLIGVALVATPRYRKIPGGLQNLLELAVSMLRKFVVGMIGPHGERYVGYISSLFLFILIMNLMGLVPGGRAPTMTMSTTLALGLSTFVYVQGSALKANGLLGYLKHLCGPIALMAPLMFFIELIGECVKPISLALRLRGNIYGEDMVIENLMHMGGWLPLQFPMYLFGIFTSFLQAFIFSALSCIYLALLTAHEEGHGEPHGEPKEHHAH
jgi:F-type H+-transporting ATPase subunit a